MPSTLFEFHCQVQLRFSCRGAEVDAEGEGAKNGSELVKGWSKSLKVSDVEWIWRYLELRIADLVSSGHIDIQRF